MGCFPIRGRSVNSVYAFLTCQHSECKNSAEREISLPNVPVITEERPSTTGTVAVERNGEEEIQGLADSTARASSPGSLRTPKLRISPAHTSVPTEASPSSMRGTKPRTLPTEDFSDEDISYEQNLDLSNAGSHLDIQDGNLVKPEQIETLQNQLLNVGIEWPKGSNNYFTPVNEINRLITGQSISMELRTCESSLPIQEKRELAGLPLQEMRELAGEVWEKAPKLFAILTLISMSRTISEFILEGVGDKDLPFVREDGSGSYSFTLRSRLHETPLKCMAKWTRIQIQSFSKEQWRMLAPIFKEYGKVRHYPLDDNSIMPFMIDLERSEHAQEGGFSSVWGVEFHPAHQSILKSTKPQKPNPMIAIKRLHSTKEETFRQEVEMLKAFSNHQHPHLIKLLATYYRQGKYHLLFPYCPANLGKYWEDNRLPEFSLDTIRWSLLQCKGIASGLSAIHEYKPSLTRAQSTTETSSAPSGKVQPGLLGDNLAQGLAPAGRERLYGRHGDIKPANILWTVEYFHDEEGKYNELGIFLIADFGLMDLHGKGSRSDVEPNSITATPTYEPPERKLKVRISRAYDIWSLGCVYLEFITWLVSGYDGEGLGVFSDVRGKTGVIDDVNDDTFFTLVEDRPRKPLRAIVRESVTEWIKDLHERPRCSKFIHDFLDLVSKHMLVVDPNKRIQCGPLNVELKDMCRKGKENPDYLLKPMPYKPRPRGKHAEQLKDVVRRNSGKIEDSPPPSPTEGSELPRRHILKRIDSKKSLTASPQQRPMSPTIYFMPANAGEHIRTIHAMSSSGLTRVDVPLSLNENSDEIGFDEVLGGKG